MVFTMTPSFDSFKLSEKHPTNLKFISFTHYSDEVVSDVVFETENLFNTVGEVIAEMEKHNFELQRLKSIHM